MRPNSIRGVVADTCFWIEAFDRKGAYHASAAGFLENLASRDVTLLVPWPIMYEVLRTKTVEDKRMVEAFQRIFSWRKILRIDDTLYRAACLEQTLLQARTGRPISLVDMAVRAILDDEKYRVSQLLTFNVKDFHDVCRRRNIAVWPE